MGYGRWQRHGMAMRSGKNAMNQIQIRRKSILLKRNKTELKISTLVPKLFTNYNCSEDWESAK